MRAIVIIALSLIAQMTFAEKGDINQMTKKPYTADWKTYQPEGGVKDQQGRVLNSGVKLLSAQEDFEKNTTEEELAKLIGFIQHVLTKESEGYEEGGEIILQIELSKTNSPNFEMSYQGELKEDFLQDFYDALSGIELETKENEVALQVHFVVKNA